MGLAQTSTNDRATASNPFQVYPVQPLSELQDIRAATVETPEICTVRDAVIEFAKTFNHSYGLPPRHLVMAIKGDFGTGKTHLMMYALSLLEAEVAGPNSPSEAVGKSEDSSRRSRALLAVGSEVSIEDWYRSAVGPQLIKSARPRELIRELMTAVACEIAEQNEKTRQFAAVFRESPQQMFDILRAGDLIDTSKVESLFIDRLGKLASDASEDCRRCLAALRWTETASIAERWFSCAPVDDADLATLGVSSHDDHALRASEFIAAVASICRSLNRPFALLIDEFEHLARFDDRNKSRRNVTWLKRLIETLTRQNAMVFVSGHWKAWEQLGDFLDRFTGRPAVQLVRLDTGDIAAIVNVIAPNWTPYFPSDACSTLADVTSGNIRRVMTVLYDLYAKTSKSGERVTPKLVSYTAAQRLHRAPEEGFLGTIEQTVRAKGGVLERDAIVSGERFDGVARIDAAPRLVIRVLHARDEGALLAEGEKFADEVQTIRRTNPRVRGLFIALGAVNPEHLRTLDAARTEVDVVDGEDSAISPKMSRLVATALTDEQERPPQSATDIDKLREELKELRIQVLDRSSEQAERARREFTSDQRGTVVRESIGLDAEEIARQKIEIEHRDAIAKILADERRFDPLLYLGILYRPVFIVPLAIGLATLLIADNFLLLMSRDPLVPLSLKLFGYAILVGSIYYVFHNITLLMKFRRFRLHTLENMADKGASPTDLRDARMTLTRNLERFGPRRAERAFSENLSRF